MWGISGVFGGATSIELDVLCCCNGRHKCSSFDVFNLIIIILLLISQCGSSTTTRKATDDANKLKKGMSTNPTEWKCKAPYDFTGCLAHIHLTYNPSLLIFHRITGIINHNPSCKQQEMKCLPPVPLHPHVWHIALSQINDGAT